MTLYSSQRVSRVLLEGLALVAAIGSLALAPAIAFADGSQFRGGCGLTGNFADQITAPLALEWRFTSTYFGHNPSSPAIADGVVYFASGNRVYALDEATGAQKWRYPVDQPMPTTVHSSPSVVDGTAYFGADDGKLYALDAKSGKEIWRFDTRSSIGSSPTIADGVVYFGSLDGRVWAVDAKTGAAVNTWRGGVRTLDEVAGAPAVANGFVYALSADQVLHAIGTATGKERWFTRLQGSVRNMSPVALGENLIVANGSNLTSLMGRNGMLRWTKMLGTDVAVTPAANDTGIYVVLSDNRVVAFDPRFGKEKWKVAPKLDYDVLASPTVSGRTLLVGTALGGLYAIDTETGAVKWTYSTLPSSSSDTTIAKTTNIAASPVVANMSVFVMSDDGSLSAFRSDAPDSLGPDISDTEPEMGIVINGSPPLRFSAKIVDEGSGINPDSVKLLLDGNGIARKPEGPRGEDKPGYRFDTVTSTLDYEMEEARSASTVHPLADGRHTVSVVASDWKGNTSTKTWSFTVDNTLVKIVRTKPKDNALGGQGGMLGGKLGSGGVSGGGRRGGRGGGLGGGGGI